MLLNSNNIKQYILDPDELAKEAQVGVDLTLKAIAKIKGLAIIPKKGKTIHADTEDLQPNHYLEPNKVNGWWLKGGKAYSATLNQGLKKLPPTLTAEITHRSSLNRNGCIVTGSIYDPGYSCKNLGCTIYPTEDIFIEEHARIAQITIQENQSVTNLYDGQYKEE